jgi:hypothetical protein
MESESSPTHLGFNPDNQCFGFSSV